jgi:hypothetical protein
VQEYLNFGLASHACFPRSFPREGLPSGGPGVWTILLAVNVALLAACVLGLLTSGLAWRRLRPTVASGDDVLEPREGRLRVFAASGLLVALLFALAIAFNTVSLAMFSACSQV